MAKKPCRKCDHVISEWKNNCPKCGIVNPTITAEDFIHGIICLIGLIISWKIGVWLVETF
jgi:RNA polymerase subunit RPABC4/transcription elongation factor Spt4